MKSKAPSKIVTPPGTAMWSFLKEPDRRFKDAVYRINLRLGEAVAMDLLNQLQKLWDGYYNAKSSEAGEEIKRSIHSPWGPAIEKVKDEDTGQFKKQNLPGIVELKFKRKATGTVRGEEVNFRPVVLDAQRHPMTEQIGNGSIVKVSFIPYLWPPMGTPATAFGVGITLQPRAIQVLDLVEFTEGGGDFGFEEEAGFETSGIRSQATSETDDFDDV